MLSVTRIIDSKKGGTTFRVELRDDKGHPTGREITKAFASARHYDEAAKLLGVDVQSIIEAVAAERSKPIPEAPEEPAQQLSFSVRPIQSNQRTYFATIDESLAHRPDTEAVIEWEDISQCCAVDFDWHGVDAPDNVLLQVQLSARPAPRFAWVTRSGGLRLIYTGPHAESLAAAGAVSLYQPLRGCTGIEPLTRTRFPSADPVRFDEGTLQDIASQFADEVDTELVETWCEANGYVIGQRYSHDRCPIDPGHQSNAPDPVYISEHGVFCHSCAGRTGNGHRSFAFLLGIQVDSALTRMVKGFTHWDHARLVMVELYGDMPEAVLRGYYKACLLARHGVDDARIEAVFRPLDLVRFAGFWGTCKGEARHVDHLKMTIGTMPAVQNEQGKCNPVKYERFLDTASLDEYGYLAVKPVHGMRIGTFWHNPGNRPYVIVPHGSVAPKYIGESDRLAENTAWEEVERAYPRIDRRLIELLVVARGMVERDGSPMPPLFLFDGVSGAGKTSHIHIAAAICGDYCSDIVPSPSEERMGQKIFNALERGTFAVVNEVEKASKKARTDARAFLDFVLHLSPYMTTHVLYRGQVPLNGVPVMALTDNLFSDEVLVDAQLGRRIFYRPLGSEPLRWKESTQSYGLTKWDAIRSDERQARAVDSLLSLWIDRYFLDDIQSLDDAAAALGIGRLDTHGPAAERLRVMAELFRAWRAYSGLDQVDAKRKSINGWKVFRTNPDIAGGNSDERISIAWAEVHDEGNPVAWSRSSERSWATATEHPRSLRIEVKPARKGRTDLVAVKFSEEIDGTWRTVDSI